DCVSGDGNALERVPVLRTEAEGWSMSESAAALRCAIYTRKSTEEGLEQEFNTLQAQRESAEAYIASQRLSGWSVVEEHYDDGGFQYDEFAGAPDVEHSAIVRAVRARDDRGEDARQGFGGAAQGEVDGGNPGSGLRRGRAGRASGGE